MESSSPVQQAQLITQRAYKLCQHDILAVANDAFGPSLVPTQSSLRLALGVHILRAQMVGSVYRLWTLEEPGQPGQPFQVEVHLVGGVVMEEGKVYVGVAMDPNFVAHHVFLRPLTPTQPSGPTVTSHVVTFT